MVRVMRSKTGRGGKTVTLITGLPGSPAELEKVLKRLKSQCGTGGALEGRNVVIQGDLRDRVLAALEQAGHRVKLAGG
jgi:translation initiation factor 1